MRHEAAAGSATGSNGDGGGLAFQTSQGAGNDRRSVERRVYRIPRASATAPLAGLTRDAGYLFQQDAVMPWKTALDNVALALEIHGTTREAALDVASSWLGRVGLSRFANRYPHELSGGQRKRVGLAQILI
eukprot:gene21413-22273_t